MDPIVISSLRVISVLFLIGAVVNLFRVMLKASAAASTPSSSGHRSQANRPSGGTARIPANSMNAGVAAHQQRSAAKTAKLPADKPASPVIAAPPATPIAPQIRKPDAATPPSTDDDAMESLFSGVSKSGPDEAERKASRLAELGFHHSINTTAPADKPAVPAAPRSNTAELNAILERIDQFLADEPKDGSASSADTAKAATPTAAPITPATSATPTAPGTTTPPPERKTELMPASDAPAVTPVALEQKPAPAPTAPDQSAKPESQKTTPLWARPDAVDDDVAKKDQEDNGQQRLF